MSAHRLHPFAFCACLLAVLGVVARRIVESTPFDGESSQPSGAVTLSVGVAAARTGDGSSLVHAADMALYEAKTAGRNRVVIEAPLT